MEGRLSCTGSVQSEVSGKGPRRPQDVGQPASLQKEDPGKLF